MVHFRSSPGLIATKHQPFQRHPPHLPWVAFRLIHEELALSILTEGRDYLEEWIALLIVHKDSVSSQREYHRFAHFIRFKNNPESIGDFRDRELVRRVFRTQRIARFDILFNLVSKVIEDLR
jgi:hypothetical protein